MKILTCNPDGGAYHFILNGYINSFKAADIITNRVDGKNVPQDFDLYLGCSGWRQNIPPKHKRHGKVGIHVNPYGPKKVNSVDGGPVIDESNDAIKWTITQQPDFVYCYCSETFVNEYFGYWTSKHGIPVVGLPTAADITIYKPHKPEPRFECEIGWVGGKWPYKAVMLDKYLTPLFTKKCLIYGWANTWRNNRVISDTDVPILFSTAKICPSISESHTVYHPIDVPERIHKIITSGGFTIHTPSPAIPDMYGDVVPIAKNVQHWLDLIDYYLIDDDKRRELAICQRNVTLEKHTYFDRCIKIANIINDSKLNDNLVYAKQLIISENTSS